jgi:hypothetical protein
MNNNKDDLISASELARRLKIDPSHISRQKNKLKNAKCMFGKKFYYIKSCNFLGKDPNDPHKSRQSNLQTDIKAPKKNIPKSNENFTVVTGKNNIKKAIKNFVEEKHPEESNNNPDSEAKDLLEQILESIKDGNNAVNRQKLDLLRQKAGVLREYFTAKNEEIKNRKLEENLFDRDEVIRVLSFAMNMVRNSLIDLPNNYAVSIEGMSQKEIKDYVTDDTNKILEDLQRVGFQFE